MPFVAHTTQTWLWSLWYSNTTNYWWLFLPSTWIITTPARDLYINAIMSLEIGHISTYLLKARDTHFSSHLPEVHFPVWSAISTAISCEGKEKKKKKHYREFRAISDKSCYIFLDSPQSASEQQPCWKVFNAQNLFLEHIRPTKEKKKIVWSPHGRKMKNSGALFVQINIAETYLANGIPHKGWLLCVRTSP